jgi:hypothetical protein
VISCEVFQPGETGSIASVQPRYENFVSGIGRENHAMMLDHHSQTKNLLVSYSTKPLGQF